MSKKSKEKDMESDVKKAIRVMQENLSMPKEEQKFIPDYLRFRNIRHLMLKTLTDTFKDQLAKKVDRKEEGIKPFKMKEMADVVEALIGTVGLNCGM